MMATLMLGLALVAQEPESPMMWGDLWEREVAEGRWSAWEDWEDVREGRRAARRGPRELVAERVARGEDPGRARLAAQAQWAQALVDGLIMEERRWTWSEAIREAARVFGEEYSLAPWWAPAIPVDSWDQDRLRQVHDMLEWRLLATRNLLAWRTERGDVACAAGLREELGRVEAVAARIWARIRELERLRPIPIRGQVPLGWGPTMILPGLGPVSARGFRMA
jgi:hypothetical protein